MYLPIIIKYNKNFMGLVEVNNDITSEFFQVLEFY